jgi:hypothetical protein
MGTKQMRITHPTRHTDGIAADDRPSIIQRGEVQPVVTHGIAYLLPRRGVIGEIGEQVVLHLYMKF